MRSRLRRWGIAVAVPALVLGGAIAVPAAAASAPTASTAGASQCVVEDAAMTWGFKESFRSYISGSIARGEWTVADGAQYETPNFRFVGGTGAVDARAQTGAIDFTGAITFTGHDGILDTTIANPVIELRQSGAVLVADITGTTQAGDVVDERAVDFVTLNLDEATSRDRSASRLALAGIPTVLTDAGARAFGTYQAGEPFDPIDLELDFAGECAAPADTAWLYWVAGGLVVAGVVAVSVSLTRRRSAAETPAE